MAQEKAPTARVSQEKEYSQRCVGTQGDPCGKHTVICMFAFLPPGPWSSTVWGRNPGPLELLGRCCTVTVHPRQGFMQPGWS